jgi:hypothetical protein
MEVAAMTPVVLLISPSILTVIWFGPIAQPSTAFCSPRRGSRNSGSTLTLKDAALIPVSSEAMPQTYVEEFRRTTAMTASVL